MCDEAGVVLAPLVQAKVGVLLAPSWPLPVLVVQLVQQMRLLGLCQRQLATVRPNVDDSFPTKAGNRSGTEVSERACDVKDTSTEHCQRASWLAVCCTLFGTFHQNEDWLAGNEVSSS